MTHNVAKNYLQNCSAVFSIEFFEFTGRFGIKIGGDAICK